MAIFSRIPHDKRMFQFKRFVTLALFAWLPAAALAQPAVRFDRNLEDDDRAEFESLKHRLDLRYEGYFQLLKERERQNRERMKGSVALREERRVRERALETARREFVKSRQAKVYNPSLEKAWQEELRQREKAFEKARVLYQRKRVRLSELERSVRRIPEDQELGLK